MVGSVLVRRKDGMFKETTVRQTSTGAWFVGKKKNSTELCLRVALRCRDQSRVLALNTCAAFLQDDEIFARQLCQPFCHYQHYGDVYFVRVSANGTLINLSLGDMEALHAGTHPVLCFGTVVDCEETKKDTPLSSSSDDIEEDDEAEEAEEVVGEDDNGHGIETSDCSDEDMSDYDENY